MYHVAMALALSLTSLAGTVAFDTEEALAPHPSVRIESDAELAAHGRGVRSGSGTHDDPYRIGSFVIAHTEGFAIRIANTTSHVVIENVTLVGASAYAGGVARCVLGDAPGCERRGIELENASHVRIRNVTILDERVGIRILRSHDVVVEDASIRGTIPAMLEAPVFHVGMEVLGSERVYVRHVHIADARWNYQIHGTSHLRVTDSVFGEQGSVILPLVGNGNSNVTFLRNTFPDVEVHVAGTVRDIRFIENVFRGSASTLRLENMASSRFEGFVACGNVFDGFSASLGAALFLAQAPGAHVQWNSFSNTSMSVLVASDNATIENNTFQKPRLRSMAISSQDVVLRNNSFDPDQLAVYVGSRGSADARFNWWGHESGPGDYASGSGARLAGTQIAYDPWLLEAPGGVPACSGVAPTSTTTEALDVAGTIGAGALGNAQAGTARAHVLAGSGQSVHRP